MNPHAQPGIAPVKTNAIQSKTVQESPSYHEQKRRFDCVLAMILLAGFSPILALLASLVRLTSRGPAIYRQVRVGKDGRCFVIYKLRSMVTNAEADGPVWSCGGSDPRVTGLGRFLRASHLDELPQLWNVIRGDMAIVGPRPERPELVEKLEPHVPGYRDRLVVRPGISGLAQINLPSDSSIDSVKGKLTLDLEYIQSATPMLDFRILVWTSGRFFAIPSAWAADCLGLQRSFQPLPDRPADAVLVENILSQGG